MAQNPVQTLVIDNFKGNMTPYIDGDANSGLSYVVDVFGYDPFIYPGNLTWYEDAVQIDAAGSVITDLIVAGKTRVESGVTYVYAIGHTGRLYKIQVNDPTTYDPNYDNPVLLATLTAQSPTFTRGGFIDFYGTTEKIYIGHDKGVTSIAFDGTGEAFVGALGSWTQNVPRPIQQFLGKLYIGNGSNIAEIDSTLTVTSYTKLSPGFPSNTQVRDIDVTPEGNYLQMVVSSLALRDITSTTPPTSIIGPENSYLFSWDGTSTGYTSYVTYPTAALSANHTFGDQQYLFGYDARGGGVWNPVRKFVSSSPTSAFGDSPSPNAVFSSSGMIFWATTLPFEGHLEMLLTMYGSASDYEYQQGYWAPFGQAGTGTETDVLAVPYCGVVSNWGQGGTNSGYTSQIFGEPKIYFSTLETSASTTAYKLYKWSLAPSGLGTALVGGYWVSQRQLFSKKVQVKEVRVYGDPWVSGNAFTVDIVGSGGAISGASKSFSVADGTLTAGTDFARYTPQCAPTYSIGVGITNDGETNHVINKVEVDYAIGGQ